MTWEREVVYQSVFSTGFVAVFTPLSSTEIYNDCYDKLNLSSIH